MKKFLIKVNGNQYEVEVEEIKDGTGAVAASESQASSVAAAAEKSVPKSTTSSASVSKSVPAGAEEIKAPMPGTILKVQVKTGDSVKKGDVMLVLEAMKMENEIAAPRDGTVASVNVETGASVNAGDTMVSLN